MLDAEARKISLNDVVKRAFAAYLTQSAATAEGESREKIKTRKRTEISAP